MSERFSVRHGFVTPRDVLQIQDLDRTTRVHLWNVADRYLPRSGSAATKDIYVEILVEIDGRKSSSLDYCSLARADVEVLFDQGEFHVVMDCLEAFSRVNSEYDFDAECNAVFERDAVAWRFVGGVIVPLAEEEQVQAIEDAMGAEIVPDAAKLHLSNALKGLRPKGRPDPAGVARESINAVEAAVRQVTGKSSFSDGLKVLKSKAAGHPAFADALEKLYAYTSDADIRHAKKGLEDTLNMVDAVFFVTVCSAFVSWVCAHEVAKT